jgi:hypothetical protein
MDLPIKFPSDIEIITKEVARFRALSPESRVRSIRGLLAAGALMMRQSPKAAFLRQYTLEQENRARQAVKEFLARHSTSNPRWEPGLPVTSLPGKVPDASAAGNHHLC